VCPKSIQCEIASGGLCLVDREVDSGQSGSEKKGRRLFLMAARMHADRHRKREGKKIQEEWGDECVWPRSVRVPSFLAQ